MFKVIIKHAPKYIGASSFATVAALIMTKYYTAVFTPAQFGILALYLIMFNYIRTFVSLTMDSSATRFYFDYRHDRRNEYLSTIFWFITTMALIVLVLGISFKGPISGWIAPNTETIYSVTLLAGITAVYVSFFTRVLYNEHKSTSVLKHTVFQTVVNHLSSVIFISIFHLGIFGRISGQGTGYTLNVFSLLIEFYKENLFRLKLVFNRVMAKETFMLALPGIIASFQNVIFIYMDRIFIKHFMGDSPVGIYTLGYMLGQGLSMVYEAISQAILPKVYNDMGENYDTAIKELEHFSYRYYAGLAIITVIIVLLSPVIVAIFSNDRYSEASSVMPFIVMGFMMGGFYKIPALVLGYHKIVWFYAWLSIVSFGTNALLNWYLIPLYGISGAAFASFVGLFIYSLVLQMMSKTFMSQRYNKIVFLIYAIVFISIFLSFSFKNGL